MTAKRPEERCSSLSEVIDELLAFLGLGKQQGNGFALSEEHVGRLRTGAEGFSAAGKSPLRTTLVPGLLVFCSLCVIGGLLFGSATMIGFGLATALAATLGRFVLAGWWLKGPLYRRVREYLFRAGWPTWAACLIGLVGSAAVLLFSGQLPAWIGGGLVGLAAGAGVFFLVDRPLWRKRRPALQDIEGLLRSLRRRGLDEESLQEFVARHNGPGWEELFEALFGYDAKIALRARRQSRNRRGAGGAAVRGAIRSCGGSTPVWRGCGPPRRKGFWRRSRNGRCGPRARARRRHGPSQHS